MHILHVTPYFPPTWSYGGIPRIVDGLSRALAQKGVTVSILTTDVFDRTSRHGLAKLRQENGMTVLSLPNLSNRLAYRQIFLPLHQGELQKISKPDVIHMHGHRHLLNNIAFRHAKRRGIPFVFTANGTLHRHERRVRIKKAWDALLSGHIPRQAHACIAVSAVDVHIHRAYGIPATKIVHIPNGLDLAEFESLPPRGLFRKKWNLSSDPIICYLGQLSPRKGVVHLIKAFEGISSAQLVIAGNDMGAMKEAKRAAKNRESILFTGVLRGRERLELLSDATILVYASTDEIFGLSPFEGLLCGAPAIVGDDCGCGELISKAQAGLLVKHGDIASLNQKLRTLLQEDAIRTLMVKRGRDYIQKELAFTHIAQKHIDLYARIQRES
ncbi:MAG: glycosyltransferase family 4 protein [Myxococcota bacterium]|nr:glycosyltransferase family 4 protein [Myxococcota bacterium]